LVHGKNLGRAGALERENATTGSDNTLRCPHDVDSKESTAREARERSEWRRLLGGHGGESPREDENQEGIVRMAQL